jgi:hypothetical protein
MDTPSSKFGDARYPAKILRKRPAWTRTIGFRRGSKSDPKPNASLAIVAWLISPPRPARDSSRIWLKIRQSLAEEANPEDAAKCSAWARARATVKGGASGSDTGWIARGVLRSGFLQERRADENEGENSPVGSLDAACGADFAMVWLGLPELIPRRVARIQMQTPTNKD